MRAGFARAPSSAWAGAPVAAPLSHLMIAAGSPSCPIPHALIVRIYTQRYCTERDARGQTRPRRARLSTNCARARRAASLFAVRYASANAAARSENVPSMIAARIVSICRRMNQRLWIVASRYQRSSFVR